MICWSSLKIHNGEWYYGCDLAGNKGEFPKNRVEPFTPPAAPQQRLCNRHQEAAVKQKVKLWKIMTTITVMKIQRTKLQFSERSSKNPKILKLYFNTGDALEVNTSPLIYDIDLFFQKLETLNICNHLPLNLSSHVMADPFIIKLFRNVTIVATKTKFLGQISARAMNC